MNCCKAKKILHSLGVCMVRVHENSAVVLVWWRFLLTKNTMIHFGTLKTKWDMQRQTKLRYVGRSIVLSFFCIIACWLLNFVHIYTVHCPSASASSCFFSFLFYWKRAAGAATKRVHGFFSHLSRPFNPPFFFLVASQSNAGTMKKRNATLSKSNT